MGSLSLRCSTLPRMTGLDRLYWGSLPWRTSSLMGVRSCKNTRPCLATSRGVGTCSFKTLVSGVLVLLVDFIDINSIGCCCVILLMQALMLLPTCSSGFVRVIVPGPTAYSSLSLLWWNKTFVMCVIKLTSFTDSKSFLAGKPCLRSSSSFKSLFSFSFLSFYRI